LHWLDRNNWTPEMEAMLERPMTTRGAYNFDIVTETPSRHIPPGHTLATIPADTASDTLRYWAGDSDFELLDGDRMLLRGTECVRAVRAL
jgi:hypothetical protein